MRASIVIKSPLCPLRLTEQDGHLARVEFLRNACPCANGMTPLLSEAQRQLAEYFSGKRTRFTLPIALHETEFREQVLRELSLVPYGATVSYGEIARRIGKPNASRAVGLAVHRNPLPIIIPCHRVIGKNGALTGFAPGLDLKEILLHLELEEYTP